MGSRMFSLSDAQLLFCLLFATVSSLIHVDALTLVKLTYTLLLYRVYCKWYTDEYMVGIQLSIWLGTWMSIWSSIWLVAIRVTLNHKQNDTYSYYDGLKNMNSLPSFLEMCLLLLEMLLYSKFCGTFSFIEIKFNTNQSDLISIMKKVARKLLYREIQADFHLKKLLEHRFDLSQSEDYFSFSVHKTFYIKFLFIQFKFKCLLIIFFK